MHGPRSTLASSPDPGGCGPPGDPARRRSLREAPARDRRCGQVPARFGVLPSANLAKADRALSGAPLQGGIYLWLSSRRGQGAGPRLETAVQILHHRKNGFPRPWPRSWNLCGRNSQSPRWARIRYPYPAEEENDAVEGKPFHLRITAGPGAGAARWKVPAEPPPPLTELSRGIRRFPMMKIMVCDFRVIDGGPIFLPEIFVVRP